MVSFQVQYAVNRHGRWSEWHNGSGYMIDGEELGLAPFGFYAPAHRCAKKVLRVKTKYGQGARYRVRILRVESSEVAVFE